MDTHTYLGNKRFLIRRKKRPVMCKDFYSLDIKKSCVVEEKSIVRIVPARRGKALMQRDQFDITAMKTT